MRTFSSWSLAIGLASPGIAHADPLADLRKVVAIQQAQIAELKARLDGNLNLRAHEISTLTGSKVPSTAPNQNLGTENPQSTPSCSLANATDVAGNVQIQTGVSPKAGLECSINFAENYALPPVCMLTATAPNAVLSFGNAYITTSIGQLRIMSASTPGDNTVYNFAYRCIQTQ